MNLLVPDPGLVFWSALTFLILLGVLGKFAWKPILHALKVREESIEYSLQAAKKAREEVESLENLKKELTEEAKAERDAMLKEARELKKQILEEARHKAIAEGENLITSAKKQIEKEKSDAIDQLKQKVAEFSVDIASRLLEKELEMNGKQKALIDSYLKEVNFN